MRTDALIDRFYAILSTLEQRGQGKPLATYNGRSSLPKQGVYFFREDGESRQGSSAPRIVRVGTHALKEGAKSTLWKRLRAHSGTKAGGGNHRGSIFRLHVGGAMLARQNRALPSWGLGQSRPMHVQSDASARSAEAELERAVSTYIGSMPIVWIDVHDQPGPASLRGFIERNSIALLSNHFDPPDPPSTDWLGHYSTSPEIRKSGLWNVNHVDEACDPSFLDVLESLAQRT